MRPLQRWLDEPDEDIARFATTFYLLTYAFLVTFVFSMVQAVIKANRGTGTTFDLIGPCVALFLTLTMYCLAIDGRRSYKAMKAAREGTAGSTAPRSEELKPT